MAQELGLSALFYAGFSDDRHTHRNNAHTQLHPLHFLSSPSVFTVFFVYHSLPILAPSTLTLEIIYSSSDSSSGDSYSSSSNVLTTTRGVSMHLRQSFSFLGHGASIS